MISARPRSFGLSGDPLKSHGYSGIGDVSESSVGLKEMHRVPVVRAPAPLAAQVRADPPSSEHHRPLQLVLVFLGLRDRPPAPFFVRDRPNKLAVAMPAAFARRRSCGRTAARLTQLSFSHFSRAAGSRGGRP